MNMEHNQNWRDIRASLSSVDKLWMAALAVTVAYIVLITGDAYVAGIPFKLGLVGLTLVIWAFSRPTWNEPGRFPLKWTVLTLAVAIPLIWALVAFAHGSILGGDSPDSQFVAQHASRFGYLLLYFPFCDLARRFGDRSLWLIMVPILGLCAVTVGIWGWHLATGNQFGTSEVLVFKGVIGAGSEGFRVFIGNQVMFILAVSIVLSRVSVKGPGRLDVAIFFALFVCTWLSHTRGIWLGLAAACITIVFGCLYIGSSRRVRRALGTIAAGGAVIIAVLGILVVAGNELGGLVSDESTNTRVRQAPKLLDEFRENPVLGKGLGTTLDDFKRSRANPWSFELTYLQILFQMGVIGLLAMAATIGSAIWRGAVDYVRSAGDSWMPLAGVATLIGMLVASATNPYLFSAFGMLMTAVAMMMLRPPSRTER